MKVLYHTDVEDYLSELVEVLYLEDYFGFEESANEYVKSLIYEINDSIGRKHKKIAPKYFKKYGDDLYYACYKKNQRTQWYVFFNFDDEAYYIYYIGNNHSCSQHL